MRTAYLLLGLLAGCKTVWRSDNDTLSVPQPSKICNDICGTRVLNPKILGCVSACDTWSTRKIKVLTGGARNKSYEATPSCELVYENRDTAQLQPGTGHQSLSFGFSHTKGPEDSGYLSFSSGIDPVSRLVDFNKPESRRTLQRDYTTSSIIVFFQRKDPSQTNLPTFSATEASVNETKSLIVVLEEKFDPRSPFARIKSARYQESRKGALIHDFECTN
jgi:hypothetical protein